MWLRDAEPDVYARTRWLVPVGGHLGGWLTGEPRRTTPTPPRRCSTTSPAAPGPTSSSPRRTGRSAAPPIRRAHDVLGTLRPEAAQALGLTEPLRRRGRHRRRSRRGARRRGRRARDLVDVTGTAEPVAVPRCEPVTRRRPLVETHAHAVDGMLLVENPGFVSGGSTLGGCGDARHDPGRAVRACRRRRRPAATASCSCRRCRARRRRAGTTRCAAASPGLSLNHGSRAHGPRGAGGLRLRAARHRRPLRRARPRRRRRSASSAAALARGCGLQIKADVTGRPVAAGRSGTAPPAPARRCSPGSPPASSPTSSRPPSRRAWSSTEPLVAPADARRRLRRGLRRVPLPV